MSQSRPVYQFNNIIVRTPSLSVVNGLRADDRGNPTYEGVKAEHDAYIAAMKDAGVKVTVLPALEAFPDSIFVEDPALVFTEGAILLRPGAETRVKETPEIEPRGASVRAACFGTGAGRRISLVRGARGLEAKCDRLRSESGRRPRGDPGSSRGRNTC